MRITVIAALLAFAIDQASKLAILHLLNLRERFMVDVWSPFMTFRYGENTGVNFGLFGGGPEAMRWVLIILPVVVSVGLWIWLSRPHHRMIVRASGGLMIGGALANALDRLIYGYVVDFLNMSCCGISNPYVFNLADVFIFAGVAGIVLFDRQQDTGKNAA